MCRCCRHYFGAFLFMGVITIKTDEKRRHSVWLDDATWSKVQYHYKLDGCTTQNEFIDRAILFYCGYLQSEYAGDFLPKILGETLEAILSMFGDRMGKQLAGLKTCKLPSKNLRFTGQLFTCYAVRMLHGLAKAAFSLFRLFPIDILPVKVAVGQSLIHFRDVIAAQLLHQRLVRIDQILLIAVCKD